MYTWVPARARALFILWTMDGMDDMDGMDKYGQKWTGQRHR